MKPRYEHIESTDGRCWCAPSIHEEEMTVSREVFPGIFVATLRKERLIAHFESKLAPRKHGSPRKPRNYA